MSTAGVCFGEILNRSANFSTDGTRDGNRQGCEVTAKDPPAQPNPSVRRRAKRRSRGNDAGHAYNTWPKMLDHWVPPEAPRPGPPPEVYHYCIMLCYIILYYVILCYITFATAASPREKGAARPGPGGEANKPVQVQERGPASPVSKRAGRS